MSEKNVYIIHAHTIYIIYLHTIWVGGSVRHKNRDSLVNAHMHMVKTTFTCVRPDMHSTDATNVYVLNAIFASTTSLLFCREQCTFAHNMKILIFPQRK